jgi:hypothetical protein
MAHFARLDERGRVTEVNVVNNDVLDPSDEEASGIAFLTEWSGGDSNWKQTSYNSNFRKNYASVGYTYDSVRDAFIPPKPFASWVLDEDTCLWKSPVPYPADGVVHPADGKAYIWDDSTVSWVEITS